MNLSTYLFTYICKYTCIYQPFVYIHMHVCVYVLPICLPSHSSVETTDHTYFPVIRTPHSADWLPLQDSRKSSKIFS